MSLFSSNKGELAASKLAEDLAEQELYAQAADEVASGQIRHGLWAKAKAASGGGEEATEAAYLKLRVEMMKTESDAVAHARSELAKEIDQANERKKRELEAEAAKKEAAAKRERDKRMAEIQNEARQAQLADTAAQRKDRDILLIVLCLMSVLVWLFFAAA